jgi:hypothetical protein
MMKNRSDRFLFRLLAALHETRRRQAALEIDRCAHLIDEAAVYEARRRNNLQATSSGSVVTRAEIPGSMKHAG